MPFTAQGSVNGCGLATGPVILLGNWTGWLIWVIPSVVFLLLTLESDHGSWEKEGERRFGNRGYLSTFFLPKSITALSYGVYDLILGFNIGGTEPSVGVALSLFPVQFNARWELMDRFDKNFLRIFGFLFPISIFCTISIVFLTLNAVGSATIIADVFLVDYCFEEAATFDRDNTLTIKVGIVVSLVVADAIISFFGWRWARGKMDSYAGIITVYLTCAIIPLALSILDAYMGIGKPFTCGGCTVHSNYGNYNYDINWYIDPSLEGGGTSANSTNYGSQGSHIWYKLQNAFQAETLGVVARDLDLTAITLNRRLSVS